MAKTSQVNRNQLRERMAKRDKAKRGKSKRTDWVVLTEEWRSSPP